MKAAVVRSPGGLDLLEICDVVDPGAPGPGEIRVKVHATSLNFHDLLVVNGASPVADGRIPMADGAGYVESVGPGVSDFVAGDMVVSCFFPQWQDGKAFAGVTNFDLIPGDGVDGFACEYVVMPATAFTKAPHGWSCAQSATITTSGLTAWRALVVDAGLKAGDKVLLLGTGGVSIAALQIAKAMGAEVIITSASDEKLQRAKQLGADHIINYKKQSEWGHQVYELTNGGADVIIEVGGPGTLEQSINAAKPGGHIALIGVLTGTKGMVPTRKLMAKQLKLQGLIVGNRRQQLDYIKALETNNLLPVIDKEFELDQLADAFRMQTANQHFGKIVLSW